MRARPGLAETWRASGSAGGPSGYLSAPAHNLSPEAAFGEPARPRLVNRPPDPSLDAPPSGPPPARPLPALMPEGFPGAEADVAAQSVLTAYRPPRPQADRDRVGLHVALFVATLASAVWAGGALVARDVAYAEGGWPAFLADGLRYAVPFLVFLLVHEFGHYVAARVHRVRVSLPYFLPVPVPGTLGTLGAVIRIREPFRRTTQLFDVGAAGPLAGFAVALGILALALATLPPPTHLLSVSGHEGLVAYALQTGTFPPVEVAVGPGQAAIVFGDTPLFRLLTGLVAYAPPGYELMHYPLLLAGWLALFFTALNLLPVGQLDGGHVVYALFGPLVHRVVARVTTLLLLLSGGLGLVRDLGAALAGGPWAVWGPWLGFAGACLVVLPRLVGPSVRLVLGGLAACLGLVGATLTLAPGLAEAAGYSGWLLWVGLIVFLIRVDHPPVLIPERLSPGRRALGYACLVIFALCFSIKPLYMV